MASTIESSANSAAILSDISMDFSSLKEASYTNEFWQQSAPKKLLEKKTWQVWSRYLKKRKARPSLLELSEAKSSPLQWGFAPELLAETTKQLIELSNQSGVKKNKKKSFSSSEAEQLLAEWSENIPHGQASLNLAIESLAVAHFLPFATEAISEQLWWELLERLWELAKNSQEWRIDVAMPVEQGLAHQMLTGELPQTLAYFFPEMRPLFELQTIGAEALTEGISEILNGDGLPKANYLSQLRPLIACWTRAGMMAKKLKKPAWSRDADEQLHCLTTHALGLSTPEGSPLLGALNQGPWDAAFLSSMFGLYKDLADITTARAVLSKKQTALLEGREVNLVPETSDNCDWAGLAYMRTTWNRNAPVVAVDYSSPHLKLEVWASGKQLISGNWSWETTLDGKRIEPQGNWDETCWFSDDDVDYLELSIDLEGGAILERQILLARDELFLLLADNIMKTSGGKIGHRYRLPLNEKIRFVPELETREALLVSGKPVARILPLALPEWRADPRIGQLFDSEGRLQLEQEVQGRNLSCPMLIDLKKSRATKQCTWRQLTVAQSLEIQPRDVAVAYRAQCGKQQWLYYRSLTERANRTFMGQNVSLDCLVARFLGPEGEVDELLEVE